MRKAALILSVKADRLTAAPAALGEPTTAALDERWTAAPQALGEPFQAGGARGRRATILPWSLLLLGALAPAPAAAAGFAINEQSPQGTALAGAMTARVDDASAVFYNPAALGFQSGISALVGFTLISAQPSVTSNLNGVSSSFDSVRGNFVLPTFFVAARVHDRVSVGVGGFTNYGLTVDWQNPDNGQPFPGRYKVLRAGLQTFTVNPTVAVRPIPEISLAVGLDVVLGSVELARNLSFGGADGRVSLSDGATAVGANVGALVRLFGGGLSLGLSYRSAFNLNFDNGTVGYVPPTGVASVFPYTKAQTSLSMPHAIAAGIAVRPLSWLTISADMNAFLWSNTSELRLTLSDESGKQTLTSTTPRNWNDAYAGRIGFEADLSHTMSNGHFVPKVRFGFGYDQSPVPAATLDPSLPDADRFLTSVGASFGCRGLGSIDVGYQAIFLRDRTAENPDLRLVYEPSMAHILSVALVLNYDRVLGRRAPGYGSLTEGVMNREAQ